MEVISLQAAKERLKQQINNLNAQINEHNLKLDLKHKRIENLKASDKQQSFVLPRTY